MSKEQNIFIVKRFLSKVIKEYYKQIVTTFGGTCYPQACGFLKLKHHFHSPLEKSLIRARAIQYIKYKTQAFDYFECKVPKTR